MGNEAPGPASPQIPFRNKAVAALIAATGGALGLHRVYLGQRRWWLPLGLTLLSAPWLIGANDWYRSPAFFVLMVAVVSGFVEAIILALTADDRFDASFNPGTQQRNRTGWNAVLIAVVTMLVGSIILLTTIALLNQAIVERVLGVRG